MDIKRTIVIIGTIVLGGCDTFHRVDAVVLDNQTRLAISDVRATLVLSEGFGEPEHTVLSDANGAIKFLMNEPSSVTTTLTLKKDGYETLSQPFEGSPKIGLKIYLVPINPDLENSNKSLE